MPHIKPSPVELQANIDAVSADLDKMEQQPPVEPPTSEAPPAKPVTDDPQEPDEQPVEPQKVEDVDYKKKFTESTREAQVLHSKNKKLSEAIKQANKLAEVEEAELVTEYPDWEELTPSMQKVARDNLLNKKKFELLHGVTEEFEQVDQWVSKVDSWVTDPNILNKHQDLEGREDEFKVFANKPSRRGADMDDLAAAFLHTYQPTKHTGSLFETGTGGPKGKPKSDKLSIEEGARLRKTDYNKWVDLNRAGKIETDI